MEPHSKNIVTRTLEIVDLDYRVRSIRTGNVVAAFLNSRDAVRYVQTLNSSENAMYEIETTNPGDFTYRQVESCNKN